MSEKSKQLRFEDLQPHVDMLCDALENKGASSSGIPHNAYNCANLYRDLLAKARTKSIEYNTLSFALYETKLYLLKTSGGQHHRLTKIADALDIFIKMEYNK